MEEGKIKSFTDLNAWKEGHKTVVAIHNTVYIIQNTAL